MNWEVDAEGVKEREKKKKKKKKRKRRMYGGRCGEKREASRRALSIQNIQSEFSHGGEE